MLIIGEKLNSARKKVREMIENRDIKSIQDLAKKQVEGGAEMLDVIPLPPVVIKKRIWNGW